MCFTYILFGSFYLYFFFISFESSNDDNIYCYVESEDSFSNEALQLVHR